MITGQLDLDPSSRLISTAPAWARTIIITTAQAPADRRAALEGLTDVIVAGQDTVDLKAAVAALAERGHRRMLAEGGPHLLAQIAEAGLLDELCLTVSPVLAGPTAAASWPARCPPARRSPSPWLTSWKTTATCSAVTPGKTLYAERPMVPPPLRSPGAGLSPRPVPSEPSPASHEPLWPSLWPSPASL